MSFSRRHLIIPDTQVTPDTPTDHLRWIGLYINDKRPDVIVHLGDHWDMQSLSSYDRGKRASEGRRYEADIQAGNTSLRLITDPVNDGNRKLARQHDRGYRLTEAVYDPDWHLLRGNHEYRIERAADDQAFLEGTVTMDDLESPGWAVHPFLEVVELDGINYSHYFANPLTGRALGGRAHTMLQTIGASFTQGHRQVFDYAERGAAGGTQIHCGLITGACYLHDEDYLGPQGNTQWRGLVVCNEVHQGHYDIMKVSLEYLCRRYEGVTLSKYMREVYGPDSLRPWMNS